MSELRDRMDAQELFEWAAFEAVFGPLTIQERVDSAGAMAAWGAAAAQGSQQAPADFMPDWAGTPAEPGSQIAEDMIATMRGVQAKGHYDD